MSRDRFVTIMTGAILALFVLLMLSVWFAFTTAPRAIMALALVLVFTVCGAITAVAYLYTPTRLVLTQQGLRIDRPIGSVEIAYARVRSVRLENGWLGTSLKRPPGGNSGFFGIWGAFRSRALGNYTMYGTKARGAVAISTTDGTVIVTPDERDRFVQELERQIATTHSV